MYQLVNVDIDNYQIFVFVRTALTNQLFMVTMNFVNPKQLACNGTSLVLDGVQ